MRKPLLWHRLLSAIILVAVSGIMFARNTITGSVNDESGEAIIWASEMLKEDKTVGQNTDLNGTFSIQASRHNTVVVTYIGDAT